MKNNDLLLHMLINPGKQGFYGLTFVHKHTHIHIIRIVNQYKVDPTIHVYCYDLECQSNTPNHELKLVIRGVPINSSTVCVIGSSN